MTHDHLNELLDKLIFNESLLKITLSSPRQKTLSKKIFIRPFLLKGNKQYQMSEFIDDKAFHRNLTKSECLAFLQTYLRDHYKQALFIDAEAEYQVLMNRDLQPTVLKKNRKISKSPLPLLAHNRAKKRILEEGSVAIPFLVELGIMTAKGKVIASKQDKFRQINRFLEMVEDILPHLTGNKNQAIQIIDFGCGKAYLTFALYHYLTSILKIPVNIIGLDLKKDVIAFCQELAEKLNYTSLHFSLGNICDYIPQGKVDMVVTLHACDTATDAALEKAIRWDSDVILSVPCCQHELFKQVQNSTLKPLLRHGILKERFAALATDAARAQILEILGYQTQVLEFVDMEHTPKNLMLRAVKSKNKKTGSIQDYILFKESLNISPALEQMFRMELGL